VLLKFLACLAVLPALALVAPLQGEMTVAPAADQPHRKTQPKHCRLLPESRQPKADHQALAEARRQAGATDQVMVLHVPATTCNTPSRGGDWQVTDPAA
jgi:hypothetical protein